jgi:uncharacterized membrane protein YidH (DUF202 family)
MKNSLIANLTKTVKQLAKDNHKDAEKISFDILRKWVGILGILLPFILVLGSLAFSNCDYILPSISHYYYSNMKVFFVGILCAVALFLITYTGYSRLDNILTNIAANFCFGIAIFPTFLESNSECLQESNTFINRDLSTVHFICAGSFFLILALMSIFIFTQSNKKIEGRKRIRNWIYVFCGVGMILCLVAIGIRALFFADAQKSGSFVFYFETITLILFGISWLTKAEVIAGDIDKKASGN